MTDPQVKIGRASESHVPLPTRRLGPARHGERSSIESRCANGGCTRGPRYRDTTDCFRCWVGVKWTSIIQRVANANGKCSSYVGIPIGFTRAEFIAWAISTPPPAWMARPSIDRIEPAKGYVPGNIQWMEMRQNSRRWRRDDPVTMIPCALCGAMSFTRKCWACKQGDAS